MSRRQVNRGVVYTGKVGARLRPSRRGMFSGRRIVKAVVNFSGGPLHGMRARLEAVFGYSSTLPIVCRGMCGSYINGQWRPA
jgi:hypothetical protein